jgi:hypothetical protein
VAGSVDAEDRRTLREELDFSRALQKIRNKYELTLLFSVKKNEKYLHIRTRKLQKPAS